MPRLKSDRDLGVLFGFDEADDVAPPPDIVGWMQPAAMGVKGRNHVCLTCVPERPRSFTRVLRVQLAARQPCTRCGKPLETVGEPVTEL